MGQPPCGGRNGKGSGKSGTNEEAMWAMLSKGGGGAGGGTGGRTGCGKSGQKGTPYGSAPGTDEIPFRRREELSSQLDDFLNGSDTQLELPPTITGLERKFVHEEADRLGLTSQSFGEGRSRYLTLFKTNSSVVGAEAEGEVTADNQGGRSGKGLVAYSSVVLDKSSQTRLREFSRSEFPLAGDELLHCEHMTICMGALTSPKTLDNRSVANALRSQIAALRVGQEFDLKVVSTGYDDDVCAVGVVGCVSSNRSPHITVSTTRGTPPHRSNFISKWTLLPPGKQISLHGMVWERGGDRLGSPPASAWEAASGIVDDIRGKMSIMAFDTSVCLARGLLRSMHGGKPRTEAALRKTLKRKVLSGKKLWVVHPVSLAMALSDSLPAGVVLQLESRLRAPAFDALDLHAAQLAEVPAHVVHRSKVCLNRLIANGSKVCWSAWVASQSYCHIDDDVDLVLGRLLKDGDFSVGDDGSLQYSAVSEALHVSPTSSYRSPWPLGPAPDWDQQTWEIEETQGCWKRVDSLVCTLINKAKKDGESTLRYRLLDTPCAIDLNLLQHKDEHTGTSRLIRPFPMKSTKKVLLPEDSDADSSSGTGTWGQLVASQVKVVLNELVTALKHV